MKTVDEQIRIVRSPSGVPVLWSRAEQRLIRTSARIGAWGVFGASAALLMDVAGLLPRVPLELVGIGFTAGGIAAAVASTAIIRRLWRGPLRHLKVASLVGIPFGLSAAAWGAAWLSQDRGVIHLLGWSAPIMVLCGAALVALFGSGTLRELLRILRRGEDGREEPSGATP